MIKKCSTCRHYSGIGTCRCVSNRQLINAIVKDNADTFSCCYWRLDIKGLIRKVDIWAGNMVAKIFERDN